MAARERKHTQGKPLLHAMVCFSLEVLNLGKKPRRVGRFYRKKVKEGVAQ